MWQNFLASQFYSCPQPILRTLTRDGISDICQVNFVENILDVHGTIVNNNKKWV